MKTHWTRYWSEFRGRYRFIYAQLRCNGMMHFNGDGLKTATNKRKVTCKNCRRLRAFTGEGAIGADRD